MNHRLDYSRRCSPDFVGHEYSAMRGQRIALATRACPRDGCAINHSSSSRVLCSTIHRDSPIRRHPLHRPSLISASSTYPRSLSARPSHFSHAIASFPLSLFLLLLPLLPFLPLPLLPLLSLLHSMNHPPRDRTSATIGEMYEFRPFHSRYPISR